MKKITHLLIVIVGLLVALPLTALFAWVYYAVGQVTNENYNNTLFALLSKIDYADTLETLMLTAVYMWLLDTIILLVIRSWKRVQGEPVQRAKTSWFSHYWFNYRKIHLTFILLTLFITLSISAPSTIMNTFTAIVSISVLVASLTKKVGK